MKGQRKVMQTNGLLWPDTTTMSALLTMAGVSTQTATAPDNIELLWPTQLLREQITARRRDFSRPLSIILFALSATLGFIIDPMQLILLVINSQNYDWVTSIYYPVALKYVLLGGAILAILCLFALWQTWRTRSRYTYSNLALICGALLELFSIWALGRIPNMQPHHASLILIAIIVCFIVITVVIKHHLARQLKDSTTIIILSILSLLAVVDVATGLAYYFGQSHQQRTDSAQVAAITREQEQAQQDGVSKILSDSVFTLCDNSKYQVIYLNEAKNSGIFECIQTGKVYSAMDVEQLHAPTIDGAATYLGTTQDDNISIAFPSSHYLYHAVPQATPQNSLVLMVQANSERELLDNITPALLDYWNTHSGQALHLSVFYSRDISSIQTTRDFILMAALDTIEKTERLPNGNTIAGYANGETVNYLFRPDYALSALNELAQRPDLYSPDSADAFIYRRHISVNLEPGTVFTYESLRDTLNAGFKEPASTPAE